jgi:hypothetical protein
MEAWGHGRDSKPVICENDWTEMMMVESVLVSVAQPGEFEPIATNKK